MYLILSKHQNHNWISKFRLQCVFWFSFSYFPIIKWEKNNAFCFCETSSIATNWPFVINHPIHQSIKLIWSSDENGPLINLCFKRAVKQQGDQFCTSTVQRWSRLSPLLDRTINQTEEARYKWELSKSAKQRWTANI